MRVFINFRPTITAPSIVQHFKALLEAQAAVTAVVVSAAGAVASEETQRIIADCDAFVALIGPGWLDVDDGHGRLIDRTTDPVRAEILAALNRIMRFVPVILDGAAMPDPTAITPALQGLTLRESVEIRSASFDQDVARLLTILLPRDETSSEVRSHAERATATDRRTRFGVAFMFNAVRTFLAGWLGALARPRGRGLHEHGTTDSPAAGGPAALATLPDNRPSFGDEHAEDQGVIPPDQPRFLTVQSDTARKATLVYPASDRRVTSPPSPVRRSGPAGVEPVPVVSHGVEDIARLVAVLRSTLNVSAEIDAAPPLVQGALRIRIFVDDLDQYERLLPSGDRWHPLGALITSSLGTGRAWEIELAIPPPSVRPLRLGHFGQIGWTSWLAPDRDLNKRYRCDAHLRPGVAPNPGRVPTAPHPGPSTTIVQFRRPSAQPPDSRVQ